jgi:hypothetical protein
MDTTGQRPNWQPIEALPLLAQMITDGVENASEHLATIREARLGSLDDATVSRIERVFGQEAAFVEIYEEQLSRWQREPLTAAQAAEVTELLALVARLRSLTTSILARATELKTQTIESILNLDDAALGMAVLLRGKL